MFTFKLEYEDYKRKEEEIKELLDYSGRGIGVVEPGLHFFLQIPIAVQYEGPVKTAALLTKYFTLNGNVVSHPSLEEINKSIDDVSEFLYDLKQIRDYLRTHPVKGS